MKEETDAKTYILAPVSPLKSPPIPVTKPVTEFGGFMTPQGHRKPSPRMAGTSPTTQTGTTLSGEGRKRVTFDVNPNLSNPDSGKPLDFGLSPGFGSQLQLLLLLCLLQLVD